MRRTQIDGLRFFLFLSVFVFHYLPSLFLEGHYAVAAFFVLSGFLITNVLLSLDGLPFGQRLRVFYLRRSLRILPAYYACVIPLILAGAVVYPGATASFLLNVRLFADSLDGQPFRKWLEANAIAGNVHLWSMSVEEQFYLVFPFVLYAARRARRAPLLVAGIVASILCRAAFQWSSPGTLHSALLPVAMEFFLWGALFASLEAEGRLGGLAPRPALAVSALAVVLLVALEDRFGGPSWGQLRTTHFQTPVAAALAVFVWSLWTLDERHPVGRFLRWRPVVRLGEMSYSLYLVHLAAGRLYSAARGATFAPESVELAAGAFAVSLALAWLVRRLVEEPAERLRRAIPAPLRARPAPAATGTAGASAA